MLSIITAILSFFKAAKTATTAVLTGIPAKVYLWILIVAVLASIVGYHFYTIREYKAQVTTLNTSLVTQEQNNKVLKETNSRLLLANEDNLAAIKLLQKNERSNDAAQKHLDTKSQQVHNSTKKIQTYIDKTAQSQDGQIAPVLKETIRLLQQNDKSGDTK